MKCHILRCEMNHFLYNFMNYLMVDVIETAWKHFLSQLEKVSNMNDLIRIHKEFIDYLLVNALLKTKDESLYLKLLSIFDIVFRFQLIQQNVQSCA